MSNFSQEAVMLLFDELTNYDEQIENSRGATMTYGYVYDDAMRLCSLMLEQPKTAQEKYADWMASDGDEEAFQERKSKVVGFEERLTNWAMLNQRLNELRAIAGINMLISS